jgi:hypothetical protein
LPPAPARRGADSTIADARFGATPLEWARHGNAEEATVLLEAFTTPR